MSKRTPPAPTAQVRIVKANATTSVKCRCGTPVPQGGEVLKIRDVPPPLDTMFDGVSFCSPRCVRAFLLESLETISTPGTPAAEAMVTNLHELYLSIASALVVFLEKDVSAPGDA